MEKSVKSRALEIREFNRFYTNIIGLVNKTVLGSPYSLAEVRVLLEIDSAGQCTAKDLTKLLQIDPGYLSRMLNRFIKDDLVVRSKSLTDGRAQVLSLTNKGRDTFQKLSEESTIQITKILEHFPNSDQEKLVRSMKVANAILSQEAGDPIIIRTHKPGDVGYIAYRHGVLYEKEYGLDPIFERYVFASLADFINNPSVGEIWVAEAYGEIVGFVAIVKSDEENAQLRWFLIEPEYRGRGLGHRLLNEAMLYCKRKKIKHVFLWTFAELAAARHLYSSIGFVRTEEEKNETWKSGLIEERWDLTLR